MSSTLRRLPEGRASAHWSTLGASLLEGELAIIEGDLAAAVRLMTPAVEQIHTMGGGSREQNDIYRRLGHVDVVIPMVGRIVGSERGRGSGAVRGLRAVPSLEPRRRRS